MNTDTTNREERYGKTKKKHITLTWEAIEVVEAYAQQHGLNFSAALETLALIGSGRTTSETLTRLVTNLMKRMLDGYFNRYAKLLSLAAISAEAVNRKTDVLLLQMIWREARQAPDAFLDNMQVSLDPADQLAGQVRQIRDDICHDTHEEAVAVQRQRLDANDMLLLLEEGDDV